MRIIATDLIDPNEDLDLNINLNSKEYDKHGHKAALRKTGFWGRRAAGALFLSANTKRFLFAHRSGLVESPNTWGTWGGAIDTHESPDRAVKREIREESGYRGKFQLMPLVVFKHTSGFKYYNYLALVLDEFNPTLDWETQGFKWVKFGSWPRPLHPGCRFLLEHSVDTILRVYNTI
jgi:8-oxo-dGTP pyrophosphatase MutT (NUDIX family)